MNLLRLLPVLLSLALLAAHFARRGFLVVACACLLVGLLLFVRHPWSARVLQIVLVLAAVEWVRTLWGIAAVRHSHGQPWTRMALILGGVAAFTLASALVFRWPALRRRYRFAPRC